jgi:hypothetical protein
VCDLIVIYRIVVSAFKTNHILTCMSYSESEVISRELKVGYALSSYQECPVCLKHIEKGEINFINEKVIKHPVTCISTKKFYHIRCYDIKQYLINHNRTCPAHLVDGFELLSEPD